MKIGVYSLITLLLVILLPCLTALMLGVGTEGVPAVENPNYDLSEKITVVNPDTSENEMSFETYICGVVAAEMPPGFETEALKAQAVAARTYAYKRMEEDSDLINTEKANSIYQAYYTIEELREKWGSEFAVLYDKISAAVKATEGEIMIYEDVPIEAVFHSTSAGMTENAENVWLKEYPYLKSVDSAVDSSSPEYVSEAVFENDELLKQLRRGFGEVYLTDSPFERQFQIISRSGAGYVDKAQLGNLTLTGRQIREALGLKSSSFTVRQDGSNVIFTTKGYGHGVGMSQYGANAMAEQGYNYEDILKHYYAGISIIKTEG